MGQFGILVLLAGTAALGGAGSAVGGPWSRVSMAVVVISVAAFCILALRLCIAQAAGSLAASQQVSAGRKRRGRRGRTGDEGGFNDASQQDHGPSA